jgi:hypothetical protein
MGSSSAAILGVFFFLLAGFVRGKGVKTAIPNSFSPASTRWQHVRVATLRGRSEVAAVEMHDGWRTVGVSVCC